MPRIGNSMRNLSLLTAALEGLELQKQRINDQIEEVRSLLRKIPNDRTVSTGNKRPAARLSVAARKRIAAAQKRRWAEYRKSAGGKPGH